MIYLITAYGLIAVILVGYWISVQARLRNINAELHQREMAE